ncbi:uncharacterized protein LOC132701436 [Cylas formicarius]|uniref:uncharacterized protein LOC132701436 n=1 Tax=Cylas formicarius TaxID=197179 RepID=UPI002958A3FE|nr:uncharacterized protein LOC132701436 [Cylas formicarius]
MQDRSIRSKNVILYNVPESSADDSKLRVMQDKEHVRAGLTPLQRDQIRKAHEELDVRSVGEPGLHVQYAKGEEYFKPKKLQAVKKYCIYDVIILVESWLNEDYLDSELGFSDIIIFRQDRSQGNTGCRTGGGTLIAVRRQLKAHVFHGNSGRSTAWICTESIYRNKFTYLPTILLNAFDEFGQVDCVCTDFSKTFHRVGHVHLVSKLRAMGLGDGLVQWIQCLLSGRTQFFSINNYVSGKINICSRVSQGSHMESILFNLFINDIVSVVSESQCLLFADDLKIFRRVGSSEDALLRQRDVDSVCMWSKINSLTYNVKKCCSIRFSRSLSMVHRKYSIDRVKIEAAASIKDLGVCFDSKTKFCDIFCGSAKQVYASPWVCCTQ